PPVIDCTIAVAPSGALCAGHEFSLCAPDAVGASYSWYDVAGALLSQDRCLTLGAGQPAGQWTYSVMVSVGSSSARCTTVVAVSDCAAAPNCPRGAGFWAQTCPGGANAQISISQMTAIAKAADARSAFFAWDPTGAAPTTASLCSALNPPRPMDA